MLPKTLARTMECRDDLIESYRDRILEVAVPKVTNMSGKPKTVEPRQKFYPVEDLRKIFTMANLWQILSHPCRYCATHLPASHPARLSLYPESVLETDAAVNLFALLVVLRHPLLIGMFLTAYEFTSLPSPQYFSMYDLCDRQFKHLPSKSKEQLAAAFQEQKWQFSVPALTTSIFQRYRAETILPFLDEELVGKGDCSTVFKVWVHPSYCTLFPAQIAGPSSRNPGTKVFARTEIIDNDAIEFIRERTDSSLTATVKDPHLVHIQKAYQLGDKLNILFQWPKTNLFYYLRDPVWRAPQGVLISKNPLWEQVLGITIALSKIINFVNPDKPRKNKKPISKYCCDLNPQYILIDNSVAGSQNVLKIIHFGQATFLSVACAESSPTKSFIKVHGSTDAYAPPQYLEAEPERDQVYDVWSLAIIVLEVLAYTIRGVEGLSDPETGLDNVRTSKVGGQTDTRFYTVVESSPIVKPKIRKWITGLLKDPLIQDNENQQFVHSLCQLIMLMLEPQIKMRIGIDTVVAKMGEIFNVIDSEVAKDLAESFRARDEKVLVDLRTVGFYPQEVKRRQLMRVPIIILENDKHVLRTYIDRPIVPLRDHRRQMKLILVFQHIKGFRNDNYEISFAPMEDDSPICLQGCSIVVDDRRIARQLQIALAGHDVSERYRLAEMTLKEYKSPPRDATSGIKALASRGSRGSIDNVDNTSNKAPVPLWIELWIEKPQATLQIVPPISPAPDITPVPRRANQQIQPGYKVPVGRVVVYCEDRILILPFERECRLARQGDLKRGQEQNITFEPMDKRQCEFFRASWLLPSKDQLPGIPMLHQNLYEAEKLTSFKCASLFLRFEKSEDAYAFYSLYKNEKSRWLDMTKGSPAKSKSMMPLTHSGAIDYQWKVLWEGAKVYEACNGVVGDVLTISKTNPEGHCYIARSVSEYLQEWYPAFGEQIVDWITSICKKFQSEDNQKRLANSERASHHSPTQINDFQDEFHEDSSESNAAQQQMPLRAAGYSLVQVALSKHSEKAMISAHTEDQQLTIAISTTSDEFALEVKSALAWTFAVLQPQKGDTTGLFEIDWDRSSSETWAPSITKFNPTKTSSYCWMSLFRYICIAQLPSTNYLYDHAREGLEIDFELLLVLAAVDREMVTDDGIILFGFDTALIPLEPPQSRRWHFLITRGRQITPIRVSKELSRLKLRAQNKVSHYHSTGKVYVGWCDNPVVKIGTSEPDIEPVEEALMTSGVPVVKNLEERSERTMAMDISLIFRIGFLGSALGGSGGTKREKKFRQVAVVAKRTQTENYERVLDSACATPCIFWDSSSVRAWLLPAVSVLLFASLRTLQVEAADGYLMDKDIFFEDIVRDLWFGMSIGEDVCSSEITGRRYETTDSLLGYDLNEAICGTKIYLRTLKKTISMESWKALAQVKQPQVIFCRKVGPVITCGSSACSSACLEQKSTHGVISCLLQDLKVFYGECWDMPSDLINLPLSIGEDFEWIPKHLNKSCSMEPLPCACCERLDRLQSITKKEVKLQRNRFRGFLRLENSGEAGSTPLSLPNSPFALRFGSVPNTQG